MSSTHHQVPVKRNTADHMSPHCLARIHYKEHQGSGHLRNLLERSSQKGQRNSLQSLLDRRMLLQSPCIRHPQVGE